MNWLDVENLSKSFGKTRALDGITLKINQPKIFGIVGPDGAGKTTLLRILVGVMTFRANRAIILDRDLAREPMLIKQQTSYSPQAFSLYTDLTIGENLRFFAKVHRLDEKTFQERKKNLLEITNLTQFENYLAGSLSGGMKMKLAITCAMIIQPKLMILDEPTTGVDILAREEIWKILRLQKDTLILISTNYMDELNNCDELIYLYQGKIQTQGTPAEIKCLYSTHLYRIFGDELPKVSAYLAKKQWVNSTRFMGTYVVLESALVEEEVKKLLDEETFPQGAIHHVEEQPMDFETVFTKLTQQHLEKE